VGKGKNTGGEGPWQEGGRRGRVELGGWEGRDRRGMGKGGISPPQSFLKVGAYVRSAS